MPHAEVVARIARDVEVVRIRQWQFGPVRATAVQHVARHGAHNGTLVDLAISHGDPGEPADDRAPRDILEHRERKKTHVQRPRTVERRISWRPREFPRA